MALKHCGALRLETDRLILRQFAVTDAAAMCKNWASDPEVTKFLTWPTHADADVNKAILEDWAKSYERKDYYQWAIVSKDNGNEPIGSIAVVGMNDDVEINDTKLFNDSRKKGVSLLNAATATAYNFILARRTSARVPKWRKAKKSRGFRAVSTHNPCIKDNVLIDPAVDIGER